MDKRTESDIKSAILEALNVHPQTFAFLIQPAGIPIFEEKKFKGFRKSQSRDLPDIVGVKEGWMFAMEIKKPGEKATDKQLHKLRSISDAGGYAWVLDSVEDAIEALKEVGRGR